MAVLLAVLCHPVPAVLAGQVPGITADIGADTRPRIWRRKAIRAAPVLVGGEPVIWVTVGAGPYTPQFRADRIGQRLHEAIRDRSIRDPTVTVTENEGSSELRAGSRLLMVVTQRDARSLGAARPVVAEQYARELESVIRAERLRYAPATLIRSGVYGLVATLALAVVVWLIRRLARALHTRRRRAGEARRPGALRLQQAEIISADRVGRALERAIRISSSRAGRAGHRSVPDLRARAVSLDARRVGEAARLCGQSHSNGRGRCRRLPAEPAVRRGDRRDHLRGDSTRGAALRPDSAGAHRVRELPGRMGGPDEQDRQGAAHRLRARRGVSLPAGASTLPRSPASRCSSASSSPWRRARRSRT